ncbi:MAG: DegV family protein [Deltaproteobacteria bacterium]
MGIQIITDTSCDLPDRQLEQFGIEIIPLKVSFDNQETFLDRVELSPDLFIKKMTSSRNLPKTSTPDPQTFIDFFEDGLKKQGQVLFVGLSSGLSATCQTARVASKMLDNEKIKVFDTLTASLGTGIFAIKAAIMAAEGLSLDTIIDRLTALRSSVETIFTLDTLENVVKGGRLSRIEGFAGTILDIKPVLRNDRENGVPYVKDKVRGRKKAIQRLINICEEDLGADIRQRWIGISHVGCEEDARRLADKIEQKYQPVNPIIIAPMSATIGTYAGVGGLMINM